MCTLCIQKCSKDEALLFREKTLSQGVQSNNGTFYSMMIAPADKLYWYIGAQLAAACKIAPSFLNHSVKKGTKLAPTSVHQVFIDPSGTFHISLFSRVY